MSWQIFRQKEHFTPFLSVPTISGTISLLDSGNTSYLAPPYYTNDIAMARKTILYPQHEKLGAKLIPFAGFDMPVRYTGDKAEHLLVREAAGMFDVSHMGEFHVKGPKALELVQKVSSNDASKLVIGKAQYSCMPNLEGGIVDDLIVYRLGDEEYMLVVNAANIEKDWSWIQASNTMGAELTDVSDDTSLIAVSGPKAELALQKLTDKDLSQLKTYQFLQGKFHHAEDAIVATTGYTGERTFEIFIKNEDAPKMWEDILEAGKEFGLEATGLGARDTLRLEMGYMLYGNDINDQTSPIEAGLGWITKLAKGDFNGRDKIAQVKEQGPRKKLVGLLMEERGIPRRDYEVIADGKVVGTITSGSMSPLLNKGIALAYVEIEHAKADTVLQVRIRNKDLAAKVVRTPFIKK